MLRLASKSQMRGRLNLKAQSLRTSPFSTGSVRFAADPVGAPKPPKKHRIRNALLGATFLGTTVSAGLIYYAIKDDDFYYTLTTWMPFASPVVDFVDDIVFKRKMASKIAATGDSSPVSPNRTSVDVVPFDGTSKATASQAKGKKEPAASATAAPPAQPKVIKEPVDKEAAAPVPRKEVASAEPPKSSSSSSSSSSDRKAKVQRKPKAVAPLSPLTESSDLSVDPALAEVKEAIEFCLHARNSDLIDNAYFAKLLNAVGVASDKIKAQREQLRARFIQEANTMASTAVESSERQYAQEKLNLVESYNNRLQLALDAVTQKAVLAANNKLSAQYVELSKQFKNQVLDFVEQERDGRLSKLAELQKDIDTLQEAMLSSGRILESEDGVVSFFVELGNLQRILGKDQVVPLKPYIDSLTRALPSDPLVKAAADAVSPSVKKYGVLSHSQLAARFSLIEPKIRQASLAPPDAGIAGHLGSLAASQLLARKEGLPEGKDVESVLARTQTHLQQGDILHAVAEVNSLQGWPKKIAADWLDEGRKRSEVEFLVTVLADEGRLWSISRTNK